MPESLSRYPGHYNIRSCLKRDNILRNDYEKILGEQKSINTLRKEHDIKEDEFDIIKSIITN